MRVLLLRILQLHFYAQVIMSAQANRNSFKSLICFSYKVTSSKRHPSTPTYLTSHKQWDK